jgi:nucleoside-diphosphate-sugar epimerase
MHVFVTGGSGFIGRALVTGLAAAGHQVTALARSAEAAEIVRARGATHVEADLETIRPHDLSGVDVVLHCAALVSDWAPPGEFERVNVEGTRVMLSAARDAGVRRFVHMSSDSVLFDGSDLVDVDEDTPYPDSADYPYAVSKRRSEQIVRDANASDFETVCVRPVLVWGPNDTSILPALVEMVDRGAFLWVDRGTKRVSTTHVDNVVQGTVRAIEHGRPGAVYFLTDGPPTTHREFFTQYLATAGRTVGTRSLPAGVVRTIGSAIDRVWRLLRPSSQPPLSREAAATLAATITVASRRAEHELGYSPTSRETAMAALADEASG